MEQPLNLQEAKFTFSDPQSSYSTEISIYKNTFDDRFCIEINHFEFDGFSTTPVYANVQLFDFSFDSLFLYTLFLSLADAIRTNKNLEEYVQIENIPYEYRTIDTYKKFISKSIKF